MYYMNFMLVFDLDFSINYSFVLFSFSIFHLKFANTNFGFGFEDFDVR